MENTVNPDVSENGNVNISDEVISVIASMETAAVGGVAGMGGSISGSFAELLGKKNLSRGVKVSVNDKEVIIDLAIIVEYGTKIPDIAWEIQEKVKSEVEAMTGLDVTAVNISVDGVNVPKPERSKKDTVQELTAEVMPSIAEAQENKNPVAEDEIVLADEKKDTDEKEIDA